MERDRFGERLEYNKQSKRLAKKGLMGFATSAVLATIAVVSGACGNNGNSENITPTPEEVGGCSTRLPFDKNGDHIVNGADILQIHGKEILQSCPVPADVVPDGQINNIDKVAVEKAVGTTAKEPYDSQGVFRFRPYYDVNRDGKIGAQDIEIVERFVGTKVPEGAFGLKNPQELVGGYIARQLVIGFRLDKDLNEEKIRQVLEERGLIVENILVFKGKDGKPTRDPKIKPFVATVSTRKLENPDNLEKIAAELLQEIGEIGYIEKSLLGGGPQ